MTKKVDLIGYLIETPNLLSIFIFSIFFNIASPILLEISESAKISPENSGLIFSFFAIGAVLGQITSISFNKKFQKLNIILFCHFILLIFTIILSFTSNFILFYILYNVSGYLLGVISLQANQYILESKVKNKEALITVFVTFMPVGAFVAPIISSFIIGRNLDYRYMYYIMAVFIIINIILYAVILGRRRKQDIIIKENSKFLLKDIFNSKSKNIIFILVISAICFYACSETIVANWVPTFFRLTSDFTVQNASILLNIFWLFIIIGRIISIMISPIIKSINLMIIGSIIAVIVLVAILFVDSEYIYIIYLLIAFAGLGCSSIYPLLYTMGATLYKKGIPFIITILFISTNIGKILGPIVAKLASEIGLIFSFSFSFFLMAFVTLLLILVSIFLNRGLDTGGIIKE